MKLRAFFTTLLLLLSVSVVVAQDDKVYEIVEIQPRFEGGQRALQAYLTDSLRYPAAAREQGIQGRCTVQFVVEKDGSITNVKVVKTVEESLDAEALRLVKNMPRWIPGRQNGVPIRVRYHVPVYFRLE